MLLCTVFIIAIVSVKLAVYRKSWYRSLQKTGAGINAGESHTGSGATRDE
jgi:hypothetical protein